MNAKSIIIGVLCAAALAAVAIWLAVGYQGRLRLKEENQGLRQQLDQMAELVADNERLSNLVVQASQSQPQSGEQIRELLRLRGEVNLLRQEGRDSPQSGLTAQRCRSGSRRYCGLLAPKHVGLHGIRQP
jgi:type II secretory pathway pseudopilin PulG